jgi:hypothetical protein
VSNIDQKNGETRVGQANYKFTCMWINKHFIYYSLQCDSFSKQDTWWWPIVADTCSEVEEKNS